MYSEQAQLSTYIDTTRGYIGDLFHLELSLNHPKGYRVDYPEDTTSLGEFTVRNSSLNRRKTGSEITYQLAVYDTGQYTIPSIPVRLLSGDTTQESYSLRSDPITIFILSMVPPDSAELRDIKPLMSLPPRIPWVWIGAGVGVLLLGGGLWWFLRRRNGEEEPEMTPKERREAAHKWALKRLREIERADYPAKGAMKQHFSEISATVRRYFENRYFFPALEMTSSEVLHALPDHHMNGEIAEMVRDLLMTADLVKFARYRASREEAGQVLRQAYQIIESTKIEEMRSTAEDLAEGETRDEEERIPANKGEEP